MSNDREKALEMALAQIDKQYGKGSIMRMGDKTDMAIEAIPTGALALDVALGIGLGVRLNVWRRTRSRTRPRIWTESTIV